MEIHSLSPEIPPVMRSEESPNPLSNDIGPEANSPDSRDSPAASSILNGDSRGQPQAVPAACLACRGKHLKCDGQTPCSRCKSSQSECVYVASRRGYKGPRRGSGPSSNKRARSTSPSSVSVVDSCPMFLGTTTSSTIPATLAAFNPSVVLPETPTSTFTSSRNLSNLQLYRQYGNIHGYNAAQLAIGQSNSIQPQRTLPTFKERCLDAFYHFFHAAHPFVLPKEWLLRISSEMNLEPLLAAIRWVGSLFLDAGPARASFLEEALRLVQEPAAKDGFLVQALVVLIVGLDGSGQQEKARQLLSDAERMAIELGMNTRPFATMNGRGIPILEESWRRTWWDLYIVDGMVAGVHRVTNFLLFDIPADVGLPCEEHQFRSGNIPQPMYLEDMEDREFSGDDREFSSFAYRIAAGRTLGKLMRMPPIFGPEDENLARIEALLTNWRMHLPAKKRDALNKDLHSDEMIFQAQMMTHATSIMLHQPHSQLDTSPARAVDSCAPHRPVPSGDFFNAHTLHTIRSASEISKMITHRVPLLSHTHFFTCVVTLSSIVLLSKWALFYIPHDDDELRQQIRLNIGALNQLSDVWNAATVASGQVKGVAQDIYRSKKAQQINPAYWAGFTQDEVINSIAADENIMQEIETLQVMPQMPNILQGQ